MNARQLAALILILVAAYLLTVDLPTPPPQAVSKPKPKSNIETDDFKTTNQQERNAKFSR